VRASVEFPRGGRADRQAGRAAAAAPAALLARWLRDLAGLGDGAAAPGRVTVHTLTVTRWVAIVGQLFTILLVHFSLGIPLRLGLLLPAVALSVLVNLALLLSLRANARLPESGTAALYAYDIAQLCYILALTGGAQNPFAALLLLPVALAAATLDLRSTVTVTGLAVLGLALLALEGDGLPWWGEPLTLPGLYRAGLAAGLGVAAVLSATFVWGLAEAARRRADALQAAQLALAREQRLSALGGQAAAAAHLLGTPLGTITIIARELVRELPDDDPLGEDARELFAQAQRCREILKTLGRSGAAGGDDREHVRFTSAPLSGHLEQLAAELARPGIETAVRVEPERGGGGGGGRARAGPRDDARVPALPGQPDRQRGPLRGQPGRDPGPARPRRRRRPLDRGRRAGLPARGAGLGRRALPLAAPRGRRGRRPGARDLHRCHLACPHRGQGTLRQHGARGASDDRLAAGRPAVGPIRSEGPWARQ
jgi:two-component system sensor histidine kinase RegB